MLCALDSLTAPFRIWRAYTTSAEREPVTLWGAEPLAGSRGTEAHPVVCGPGVNSPDAELAYCSQMPTAQATSIPQTNFGNL